MKFSNKKKILSIAIASTVVVLGVVLILVRRAENTPNANDALHAMPLTELNAQVDSLNQQHKYKEAIALIKRQDIHDKNNGFAADEYGLLANEYTLQNDYKTALSVYKKALKELNPTINLLEGAAVSASQVGDHKLAATYYDQAAALADKIPADTVGYSPATIAADFRARAEKERQ